MNEKFTELGVKAKNLVSGFLEWDGRFNPTDVGTQVTEYIPVVVGSRVLYKGLYEVGTEYSAIWGYSDDEGSGAIALADFNSEGVIDIVISDPNVRYIRAWGFGLDLAVGDVFTTLDDIEEKLNELEVQNTEQKKKQEIADRGLILTNVSHYEDALQFYNFEVESGMYQSKWKITYLEITDQDDNHKAVSINLHNVSDNSFIYGAVQVCEVINNIISFDCKSLYGRVKFDLDFTKYKYIHHINHGIEVYVKQPKSSIIKRNISPTNGLRSVLESITDSSEDKQYIIYLASGTYDLANEMTEEEMSGSFPGVFVPDYVTLEGVDRNTTIITATIPNQNVNFSVLNLKGTCTLKNLSVIGCKTRYAVHDDFADLSNYSEHYYRICDNCIFDNSNDGIYCAYGSGVRSGAICIYRNCVFIGAEGFLWHDNVNFSKQAELTLENCLFNVASDSGINIRSLASGKTSAIHLIGNKTTGYHFYEDSPNIGGGFTFEVDGYGNNYDAPIIITTANPNFADWKPKFRDTPTAVLQNQHFIGSVKYDNGIKYWDGTTWSSL